MATPSTPGITPDDPLALAGLKLLRHYGSSFRQFEAKDLDPKTVKQWRVSARRMRGVLAVFEPYLRKKYCRPLDSGLRTLAALAGEARDTHLAIKAAQTYAKRCDEDGQRALEPLIEAWTAENKKANRRLQAYCESDTFAEWHAGLVALFEVEWGDIARPLDVGEPSRLRHVVRAWVWQHVADVRAFDDLPEHPRPAPEHVHRLRIAIKHLRYLLDSLREVLPERDLAWARRVIKRCQTAQDVYGALNDAHAAENRIRKFLAEKHGGSRRVPLKGIKVYAAEQHRLVEEQLAEWRDNLTPLLKLM